MLNAAAISTAANAAPNVAVGSLTAQGNRFASASTPSFSQVFSGVRTAQPQAAVKPSATQRSSRTGSQQDTQTQATPPHTTKDSATQPGSTPNPSAGAPVAPPLTAANTFSSDPLAEIAAALSGDDNLPAGQVSAANFAVTQSAPNAAEPIGEAGAQAQSSALDQAGDPDADGAFLSATQSDALGDQTAPSVIYGAAKITQSTSLVPETADATQSPGVAKNAARTQAQPQLESDTPDASIVFQAINAAARGAQLPTNAAAAQQQRADQIHLPDAASLVSANADSAPDSKKSDAENLEIISQKIQANLASSLSGLQQGSAIQSDLAANGNDSGGASAYGGGHAPDRSIAQASAQSTAQSSTTSHSADGGKVTSSPASPPGAPLAGVQQGPAEINASTNSTVPSASSAATANPHATGQALAQADASTDLSASATANARSAADLASSAAQSSVAPNLPPNLPRALDDISQATQLDQRVGGAEMHIAMDTDLLGSIDLRAIVHQGSLSATIGVQRADVQTLLVNELPALQHSLAEKNLQVGQISVTAGSIGSGAHTNSQSQEQQNRQNTATPGTRVTPIYRDDIPRSPFSSASFGEIAVSTGAVSGTSARLSVHA